MKNKATKTAVIVASVLAVLLLTAFVIVVVRGGQLAGIFDFDKIFHRETTAESTETVPETPAQSSEELGSRYLAVHR